MTTLRRTVVAGDTEAAAGRGPHRILAVTGPAVQDVSLRTAAVVAGLGLLAMAVLSFLGSAGLNGLVIEGSAQRTHRNLVAHEQLLRWCVAAFLLVAVLDLVVACALYAVLKPAGQMLALLAAILRVAYAAAFAATVSTLLIASRWVLDETLTDSVGLRQADAHALAAVDTFNTGWSLVLTIFGIHLLVLGYVVIRAVYVPTLIGVLVMVSGAGYVIDGLGNTISGGYHLKVGAFAFTGEVVLMVWLLWAGHKLRETPA